MRRAPALLSPSRNASIKEQISGAVLRKFVRVDHTIHKVLGGAANPTVIAPMLMTGHRPKPRLTDKASTRPVGAPRTTSIKSRPVRQKLAEFEQNGSRSAATHTVARLNVCRCSHGQRLASCGQRIDWLLEEVPADVVDGQSILKTISRAARNEFK